jgi:tetratricopeptide (TPR) repeat protein
MPDSDDLLAIIERILSHQHTEADLVLLRQAISASSSQGTLQIGKYNVNIGEGKDVHIGDKIYQGADAETIREIIKEILPSQKPATAVKYIPYTGVRNFVGRSEELVKIHEKLYQQKTVAISAVSGMGGIGKTELAVKYAREHEDFYPGGICWFSVRDRNLAAEIIQFTQLYLNLEVPQKDARENPLDIHQQVAWCWQNWQPPEGLVLVVLDDVTDLKDIKEFLPKTNNRFRILITTRQRRLDINYAEISLDVLSPEEALSLLRGILGENDRRVDREIETANSLCKWLGYLPLGLELVGRYLVEDPDLSIAEMLQALREERLKNEAVNPSFEELENTEITAKLGVRDAFNLTWEKLDPKTKRVGELLSLFSPDEIAWEYVESVSKSLSWQKKEVNEAKKQLYKRHLIERLEEGEANYKIHPLIREFLRDKLGELEEVNEFKQAFTGTFIEIAQIISDSPSLEFINSVKIAIPHLIEIAENLTNAVSDENLLWAFTGLARYYNEQGLYTFAEPWYKRCVSAVKSRLGENHPHFATSLNNLAVLYDSQGRYKAAEPLYIQALELRKQLLRENNPDVATSLNNLAELYRSQERYEAAKPLYIQALELRKQLLGENHPDVATSLNNLACLYCSQGRYEVAEPLYIQALELRKQLLGENHPSYATSLNNLAFLYNSQGRYEAAEPLYIQALELTKQLLGENHPSYATSLNNLAFLYYSQGRYKAAEPLYIQALELRKQLLGENHPYVAQSLNNLAALYRSQGRYEAAEPMYIQALELSKQLLGENHPHVAQSLNNLASLYESQGRYEAAKPLYIQALEIAERVLGVNHPNTVTIRGNLEYLRTQQGESGG